jgi:hypothetical protein
MTLADLTEGVAYALSPIVSHRLHRALPAERGRTAAGGAGLDS